MTSTLNIAPDYYSRAFEFTAFQGSSFLAPHRWPVAAGAATVDSSGHPMILHIAATRWLLPDPSRAILSEANEISAAGRGTLVDCSGKYTRLELSDRVYRSRLARSVDLEEVLDGRSCAQTSIYDCPTIIARTELGLWAWVGSSHARSFLRALG